MAMAFVLINTETGSEDEVLEALKKIDAVEEAYVVFGVYDLVAIVKTDTMQKLREIVSWQVRCLDKIQSTITLVATEKTK